MRKYKKRSMIVKFNFSDEKAQMHFSPETLTSKPIQRAEN